MNEPYYRSGQAAQLLGLSAYHVRRLCEAGLIDALLTDSGQWQIPASEIERLQKEGIPPIPQGMLGGRQEAPPLRPRMDEPGDQASAAPPQAASAEVRVSADQIKIAENFLKRREVELDVEKVEDEFSRRANEKAQREKVRMEMEQRRRNQEEALQGRRKLMSACLKYTLDRVPEDAPPDSKLRLPRLLAEALEDVDLTQPVERILLLLDAVVDRALQPWRREQDIDRIIQAAVVQLPAQWQKPSTVAAHELVRWLRNEPSLLEVESATAGLVAEVGRQIEHYRLRQRVVSGLNLPGASSDEDAEAREIASQALEDLPVGASERQAKATAEAALGPLRQRIALREDEALRQDVIRCVSFPWGFPGAQKEESLEAVREALDRLPHGTPRQKLEAAREQTLQPFHAAHAQRQEKERLIQTGLGEVWWCLSELVREHNLRKNPWTLESELKRDIQRELAQQLKGTEGDEAVRQQVRSSIRRALGLPRDVAVSVQP